MELRLPIAFVAAAVKSQHPVHVVLLARAQVAYRNVLVGVVHHQIAVSPHPVVAPVHHVHTLLVGHRKRRDVHHVFHLFKDVVALLQELRVAERDGREFLGGVVFVAQHKLEIRNVDVRDFTDHQDRVPDLDGILDEIVHRFEGVVIFLTLLVNLYRLLKIRHHVGRRLRGVDDILRGIDDALREVARIADNPLRPRRARKEQARAEKQNDSCSHYFTMDVANT